jgi:hypothetical protein
LSIISAVSGAVNVNAGAGAVTDRNTGSSSGVKLPFALADAAE